MSVVYFVDNLECAQVLRSKRLLTSSLRYEPTFKQDDPDLDTDETLPPTKKKRKIQSFKFELLLPLKLTSEEAALALDLNLVVADVKSPNLVILQLSSPSFAPTTTTTPPPTTNPFIESIKSTLKYRVFHSLHEKGFTLVDGFKFGVDYLAYAGDPLFAHSNYMVLVQELSLPLDLLALCSVANKAKKEVLIASFSDTSVSFLRLNRKALKFRVPKKERITTM